MIVSKLLLNELEIAYWHTINISQQILKKCPLEDFITKLWANAVLAKTHCTSSEEADIFRAFIQHNYPEII